MKITTLLLFLGIISLYAESSYSQQMLPALDMKNVTISEVFSTIEKESHFVFLFSDEVKSDLNKKVNIRTNENRTVQEIVSLLLKNTELEFLITDRQIAVFKKEKIRIRTIQVDEIESIEQNPVRYITGVITDEFGDPLPGVTVMLKSNKQIANMSDVNGKFTFTVSKSGEVLIFSYVGMEPLELVIKDNVNHYNVKLKSSESQLKEVVVETGIFQRDRASFTGAASSFTGNEIKRVTNQNLIQGLKVLDPSFVVIDNNLRGSDPNTMATIELRGQGGSMINTVKDEFKGDPNMPLFILNGMEVNITRINDLDVNRIESVTILKDAGSTAIYGSRGSNGVIVVETIKSKPGELKVYYNAELQLEAPDLSVYNMMNAAEKLEFERLSGKYSFNKNGSAAAEVQKNLTELYNYRLADIRRGVDTYWLSEPVQTGFTHGHSARVTGGSEFLTVEAGLKYKNREGVMKGTKRETWSGNLELTYRHEKLIVSNYLDLTGYNAVNSPYGDFSTWVNTSPYFKKRNEDGSIEKFLQHKKGLGYSSTLGESPITADIGNPLYNALLNSRDDENDLSIYNSFQIQYIPVEALRFKFGLDLTRDHRKYIKFTPPENTKYNDLTIYEKGEYRNRDRKHLSYKAYLDASFAKMINKHSVTLNTRFSILQSEGDYVELLAAGFPFGSQGTPNLAYSYKQNANPDYYHSKSRGVGVIGTFNYNFDKRFLFDAALSIDGASSFGSNKLYKSFWSLGAGWNLSNESFLKNNKWIELLKLRISTGTSGNQNMGGMPSKSIYKYSVESNIFGQGAYLDKLANPNLPWSVSRDVNLGLDFRTLNGQISFTLDMFHKKTDPNIVLIPMVPSTGIASYPMDMGYLTDKGFEAKIMASPIYNLKDRIFLTFTVFGSHVNKKYGGLNKLMDSFNENLRKSNSMQQYIDGYSPHAIWAVRSNGIDPANGSEIYIKKNGDLTYDYDADDKVVVGSERPDMQGAINTSFRYKNFEFNMYWLYSYGSDIYNNALYDKVENISKESLEKNQDKRALYNRWKYLGDIAEFRGIHILTDDLPKTSRFVQKNNYISLESINCKYEIVNNSWLKNTLGVSSLIISGYLNNILRFETSKTERSIEYPFARNVSLSFSFSF